MRDYNYSFTDYSLRPFSEIRSAAPSFNTHKPADIQVSEWFTRRLRRDGVAVVKGLKGYPMEITRAKLKAIEPLIFVIDEVMTHPDEVYLFKGKKFYYYTYFKFYSDRAVMIDIGFNIDRPMRVDRVAILKPDNVDVKRKGTLYYTNGKNATTTTV